MEPHTSSVQDVLASLEVNQAEGLSKSQVQQRRLKYGPNRLAEEVGKGL